MSISYKYIKDSNLLETTISGVLTSDEIADYFDKLDIEIDLAPGFVEVVDLNNAEDLILKYSDLEHLSKLFNKLTNKGHQVTLFCAYNQFAQGIVGMMMPLFHTMKINVLVCKSESELSANKSLFINKNG